MTVHHRLPMIYVAGPYTNPDPVQNTHTAIKFGMQLYKDGIAYPVIPHLSLMLHLVIPEPDVAFWYAFDLHAVERCDALVRLPGASSGADAEVAFATDRGMHVFQANQYDALRAWSGRWQTRVNRPQVKP